MRDKAAVGADLYLEDSPDNIRALRAGGHETIVVRNSTNRDLPGPGAATWEEIEALIRDRVARWRQRSCRSAFRRDRIPLALRRACREIPVAPEGAPTKAVSSRRLAACCRAPARRRIRGNDCATDCCLAPRALTSSGSPTRTARKARVDLEDQLAAWSLEPLRDLREFRRAQAGPQPEPARLAGRHPAGHQRRSTGNCRQRRRRKRVGFL